MGTPDLAATVLSHVLNWRGGRVLAVYCQPDRPSGRGMQYKSPPVKLLAERHGLPVRQPRNFKSDEDVAALRDLAPDYLLVAAYGLILPQRVLDIPAKAALNVHTSLLPRHRGAAPIQRAIMNGDAETGVTIMRMEAGLDTGPMVLQRKTPIGPDDTAARMHDVLAAMGGEALLEALQGLEAGKLTFTPQEDENASYAAKLEKGEGLLDFSRPVAEIYARARALTPWPGAFAWLFREKGEPLAVTFLDALPASAEQRAAISPPGAPGDIFPRLVENRLAVTCGDGAYLVTSLKPAGRKAMDAAAFVNGYLKGVGRAFFGPPPER